ncbi:cryptochrome DASH [Marivirga tractuosa]|uniref:Cryptochrome DASH n=1 Tax=Marivirga tractuosa (strain ATCC 23168 / DSM 4126 / NBRC 15989 / NCIMB 1408 / VKM B-1430 / H-43) TaxID=643867 RepID=E4TPL3_MARTH|nr:DASH family cryptochrome [Marivirga tractuosa]ADR22577.1 cryptochrome, DASH family [Marivirga tractuosa DSM 4126]BDD16752.1 cryptochrome DASH [Marivirga tractuosa]
MKKKHRKSLIWFRKNLRLKDNQALLEGVQNSEKYLLLYIFDEREWKKNPVGLKRSSDKKLNFLWQSVLDLKQNIEAKGGQLVMLKGDAEDLIQRLSIENKFDALYAPKESGTEEFELEKSVEDFFIKHRAKVDFYAQTTLFHEDDIPWPIGKLPDIFTQFRKENEKQTGVRDLFESPEDLSASIPVKEVFEFSDLAIGSISPEEKSVLNFQGGETHAWERLEYYFWDSDQLKEYKNTRNGLLGERYSSKFSPWLALGCISPKSIYYQVKQYEKERKKNQSTYWMIFELIWRDYFHFVLKKFGAQLFQKEGIKGKGVDWKWDLELFEKWKTAETGVPFIDANMRELNATGFMSNRGRQNVASFLVKDLGLDWRMGAWYFEHQLIDYDVASNWGNWAYVAGVGNDPRENRYFNILSQAKKYDVKGDYVRHWIPELKEIEGFNIHKVSLMNEVALEKLNLIIPDIYLRPVVDMGKWEY